ncbi:hypothetical protein OG21DRAFT_917404 [Imleria badia]|nr:hypothetical protein OG21DRAFT_917404 [Imleria badia]
MKMDTGRLPAYRSSYLLRFHPYPRAKPSTRERIVAEARQYESYELLQNNSLHLVSFQLEMSATSEWTTDLGKRHLIYPKSSYSWDRRPSQVASAAFELVFSCCRETIPSFHDGALNSPLPIGPCARMHEEGIFTR